MSARVEDVISGPAYDRQELRQTHGADFQASPTIGKLAGALAKAQGAFEAIGKTREVKVQTKTGGSYTFAYAPLDEVLRSVRPALASNGLALAQTLAGEGAARTMTTTLLHESGEWMSSTTTLPGQATTAQEFGSQVTYMRRYAIVSILGVVADEDDDANAADGNSAQGGDRKASPPPRQAPPSRAVTEGQTKALDRALRLQKLLTDKEPNGCGWPIPKCKNWLRKHFHVDVSTDLSEEQLKDGELLALAQIEGGDLAYRNELQRLITAGRVFGEVA
jgi:hypothetical protein